MLKVRRRTEQLGYCCPFEYFLTNLEKPTKKMAEELGVTTRTIRWYKDRIKKGICTCEKDCYDVDEYALEFIK